MKISFVSTIFNEEESIEVFLGSLLKQTKLPNEVIIVDAFSKDNSLKIIQKFIPKFENKRVKFKLFKKRGNRSVGRNYGIKKAQGEVILISDAGCILDTNWVKNITKHFSDVKIDVVSGYYYPKTSSIFEKSLAAYTCVMPDRIDKKNFLPSSRSIAFKKAVWEKVKGYPEELDTCEDLVFAKNLKKLGMNFKFEKKAYVYWPQRENLIKASMQFFNYAKGDGKALYIRRSTPFLFARYVVGIIMLITAILFDIMILIPLLFLGIIFYIIWAIQKNYKYVKNALALLYLPVLQFTSDIAVLIGFSVGFLSRKR